MDWDNQQTVGFVKEYRLCVVQGGGVRVPGGNCIRGCFDWIRWVGHVEEGYLDCGVDSDFSDSNEMCLVVRLQKVRVAGDDQRSHHRRAGGIVKVQNVKRVSVVVGHQVSSVAHESGRIEERSGR